MKVNIFVQTKSGGRFTDAFPHSTVTGLQEDGPHVAGEEIINKIDESRMSSDKVKAKRFFEFLENRRMSMHALLALPVEEQNRLREEFTNKEG